MLFLRSLEARSDVAIAGKARAKAEFASRSNPNGFSRPFAKRKSSAPGSWLELGKF